MPPNQQNPYEFILEPTQGKRGGPVFLQDPRKRTLYAVLFVVGVLFIVVVLAAVLLGGRGSSTQDLRTLAAQQAEVSRIAALGVESARTPEVRQLASTLLFVVGSDLQATKAYLKDSGVELNEAQLALRVDAQRTTALEEAAQRNSFDEVYQEVLDELLAQYKSDLQTSLDAATTPVRKELVEKAASNILTVEAPQKSD